MISSIYEIAVILAAIAVSALAVFAIPAILQIKKTIKAIEELSLETKKAVETLDGILKKVDAGATVLEETINRASQTGERITEVIDSLIENVKRPVTAIGGILFAIECASKVLFRKESKKGGVENDE